MVPKLDAFFHNVILPKVLCKECAVDNAKDEYVCLCHKGELSKMIESKQELICNFIFYKVPDPFSIPQLYRKFWTFANSLNKIRITLYTFVTRLRTVDCEIPARVLVAKYPFLKSVLGKVFLYHLIVSKEQSQGEEAYKRLTSLQTLARPALRRAGAQIWQQYCAIFSIISYS
uniref:Uncharacterized protein n=1 Tax=Amphimedon queenslandica TaxID=400682 RepID=A0A1X7TYK6_AMPQE